MLHQRDLHNAERRTEFDRHFGTEHHAARPGAQTAPPLSRVDSEGSLSGGAPAAKLARDGVHRYRLKPEDHDALARDQKELMRLPYNVSPSYAQHRSEVGNADWPLEPNHTHFLLVDNPDDVEPAYTEVAFRSALEKYCCEQLGVPGVQVVLQGGRGTLRTVHAALQLNCQVIFMTDSGGFARRISQVVQPLLDRELSALPREDGVRRAEIDRRIRSMAPELKEWDFETGEVEQLSSICMHLELIHLFWFSSVSGESVHAQADRKVSYEAFDVVILNAVVKSCQMQAEKQQLEEDRRRKQLEPLLPTEPPLHFKARGRHPDYPNRFTVPDHRCRWTEPAFARDDVGKVVTVRGGLVELDSHSRASVWRDSPSRGNDGRRHSELDNVLFAPRDQRVVEWADEWRDLRRDANAAADSLARSPRCHRSQWGASTHTSSASAAPSSVAYVASSAPASEGAAEEPHVKGRILAVDPTHGGVVRLASGLHTRHLRNPALCWEEYERRVRYSTKYFFDAPDGRALTDPPGHPADGTRWREVGATPPSLGVELECEPLAAALCERTSFSEAELSTFGVAEGVLHVDHFVRGERACYVPAYGLEELRSDLENRITLHHTPAFAGERVPKTLAEAGIRFDDFGAPLNPRGRTGLKGRGTLPRWGPNMAADPIITRFSPGRSHGVEPELQMIAIRRKDTADWSIPGGRLELVSTSDTMGSMDGRGWAVPAKLLAALTRRAGRQWNVPSSSPRYLESEGGCTSAQRRLHAAMDDALGLRAASQEASRDVESESSRSDSATTTETTTMTEPIPSSKLGRPAVTFQAETPGRSANQRRWHKGLERLKDPKEELDRLFKEGTLVYCGYVDDPRNSARCGVERADTPPTLPWQLSGRGASRHLARWRTCALRWNVTHPCSLVRDRFTRGVPAADNAWVETTAMHFHCAGLLADLDLMSSASDGANGVDADVLAWITMNSDIDSRYANLYASQRDWADRVRTFMLGHREQPEAFVRTRPAPNSLRRPATAGLDMPPARWQGALADSSACALHAPLAYRHRSTPMSAASGPIPPCTSPWSSPQT